MEQTNNNNNQMFQFTHPGRGATARYLYRPAESLCFNSRTPGGVRLLPAPTLGALEKFQFTHPGRGATPLWSRRPSWSWSFNSRTPGGVRQRW